MVTKNGAMLQLCREFGFAIGFDPNDPRLLRVSKTLRDPVVANER